MTTTGPTPPTVGPEDIGARADAERRAIAYYEALWRELGDQLDPDELLRLEAIAFALDALPRRTSAELLDLGCGRGWLAPMLARHGRVTGVDLTPAAIAAARQRYGAHARFLAADARASRWGLDAAAFDVVVCSEVIEHVTDAAAFAAALADLLRPGGWLVLTTPDAASRPRYAQLHAGERWEQPVERWLGRAELDALLHAAGFGDLRRTGVGFAWRFPGLRGYTLIARVLHALGAYHHACRALRRFALYQVVVAQRVA